MAYKEGQGCQDTADGERWGSGNVTTRLETDDGQDRARKEVFF